MSNKNDKKIYSDGDYTEDNLLRVFSYENKEKINEEKSKLFNTGSWPFVYHLDKRRENILNWYDFKKNSRLLEVGAGCGAVTSTLCDKLDEVVAVELSPRRAEIIKNRLRNKKNLEVITQNILTYAPKGKFDYITSIGVFEYSAEYIDSPKPFNTFLEKLGGLLNDNGELIIAIENKFGLKYWAGAPEDHTNRYFYGLEGYDSDTKVRTFSKKELIELLNEAGFTDVFFYYPYPDYKFPSEIFSEKMLPSEDLNIFPWAVEKATLMERKFIFNERKVLEQVIKNNMFEFFSNSFLVIAKKSQ